ncbi:MAG: glutamate-semialdehyde -aminomutase [Chloroflexota bacterium]|jgi:glutamate-1-semialdehyde 2,1-aminomutase|nr:glutamate-semialdehyde -aminomutase [Chloroflexota bacterium]
MPGGVNSPVRAFKAVGGDPIFVASGQGAHILDVEGTRYLDLVASYGPLILGHARAEVVDAITRQARLGTTYGAPTEAETELAELLVRHVPSVEMVRLVSSGTEATMSAIRLARGAMARDLVVKFAGGYHGHQDYLLAEAGSGMATLGIPGSPGVPRAFTALTAVLPYNDLEAAERLFAERGGEVAAVIVEPVAGNMGVVPGSRGFLSGLRRLTAAHGTVLVFDEVISGFRVGLGGAQALLGITPDLTCLGKIIGGGLPLAAYGGKAGLMRHVAPEGQVYQAGTLSGNPLATAAGLATLRVLERENPYEVLERGGAALENTIVAAANSKGLGITVNRVGSMLTPFMTPDTVADYASAARSDTAMYARLFNRLRQAGVYVAPSQFEAWFVSLPLTTEHQEALDEFVTAAIAGL